MRDALREPFFEDAWFDELAREVDALERGGVPFPEALGHAGRRLFDLPPQADTDVHEAGEERLRRFFEARRRLHRSDI